MGWAGWDSGPIDGNKLLDKSDWNQERAVGEVGGEAVQEDGVGD